MGTIGGRIGYVIGIVFIFYFSVPMIQFILGPCYFEEGCGEWEDFGLLLTIFALICLAILVGLTVRSVVNYAINYRDS